MFETAGSLTGGTPCCSDSLLLTCWPHFDPVVRLQHRHPILHPNAEAILSRVPEGVAEVVAGATDLHQMAFVTFEWNAFGFYKPA